jgi:hypothetical protein
MRSVLCFLAASALVSAVLTAGCSSGSSGGGSACDAGACASIAADIVAHGGGSGTCNEPTMEYESACAAYTACLKQCGQ